MKRIHYVSVNKKEDKIDCNIYKGNSLLSISYKIISNRGLAGIVPYADKIVGYLSHGLILLITSTES